MDIHKRECNYPRTGLRDQLAFASESVITLGLVYETHWHSPARVQLPSGWIMRPIGIHQRECNYPRTGLRDPLACASERVITLGLVYETDWHSQVRV